MKVSKQWLFAAAMVFAVASVAAAQQAPAQNSNAGAGAREGNQAQVAISHVLPGKKIDGANVVNQQGEKIGDVKDIVVDIGTGKVAYAAISHNHKLVAVPWHSLMFQFGRPNDANARFFKLNASQDKLNNAPSFDNSHWPELNAQWAASVNHQFGVEEQNASSGQGQPKAAYETMFRGSQLRGMNIYNQKNESLGEVDDVAIDITRGTVPYLAMQYGHWYSGGSKLFAAPLSMFTLSHSGNKTYLVTGLNQDALKNAPGFDKDHWPDHADQRFLTEMNSYYERHARANTNNATGNRQ